MQVGGRGLTRKNRACSAVSRTLASVSRRKTVRWCWASRAVPRHRVLGDGQGWSVGRAALEPGALHRPPRRESSPHSPDTCMSRGGG